MTHRFFDKHPLFHLISRLLLGGVFIYAGISKIGGPLYFADNIASYHILPPAAINLVAMSLPFFEAGCGVLVITGFYARMAVLAMAGMLAIFSFAMLWAVSHHLPISCGCFGESSWLETNPWLAVIRDLFLLTLSICVYRYYVLKAELPLALSSHSESFHIFAK